MEQQTVTGEPLVRIGDHEREACIEKLTENYVRGRLTVEELNRRQDQALEAVTAADLATLVADLPAGTPTTTTLSSGSTRTAFWPASRRACAAKLATMCGVPATIVTGGALVAAYADGASDISQFSWAVGVGMAGYLTHWVVTKLKPVTSR
jgi:hypothetical protein